MYSPFKHVYRQRDMYTVLFLAIILSTGCDNPATDESNVDASTPIDTLSVVDTGVADAAASDRRDRLSQVGLYEDIDTLLLASDVVAFAPSYPLWSDNAVKVRFIKLPPGTQIDTTDMNRWQFPIGTRVYKEFALDGIKLETRMIEKLGDGPMDYWMGSFVWESDQSDAILAPDGAIDVLGTSLDVPDMDTCWTCHLGEPSRILGFSATQLSQPDTDVTNVNVTSLAEAGLLTSPPAPGQIFPAPGDAVVSSALGYLHANCGSCHNPLGSSRPDTDLFLRLNVDETTPEQTDIYQTTINVPLDNWLMPPYSVRVVPGDSSMSPLVIRMMMRGGMDDMPPIASELVHPDGVAAVSSWINGLSP